jgi:hypothetical protein
MGACLVESVISSWFFIGLLALTSVGGAHQATAAPTGALRLAPAQFAPAAGWHVRYGTARACPGTTPSRCSQVASAASTIRLRDCVECLPHQTVATMARRDMIIRIKLVAERPLTVRRTFVWPPRVTRRKLLAGFEGLPRRVSVYPATTLVGKREVFVFVIFGRALPSNHQLDRANAELRRARVP